MFCLCFHFPYKYLLFTTNTGQYMPKSPCPSPNCLLFTAITLSGYVPVSAVPSVRPSWGGGLRTLRAFCEKKWEGWIRMGEVAHVFEKLSWRNKLVVPNPIMNPITSPKYITC